MENNTRTLHPTSTLCVLVHIRWYDRSTHVSERECVSGAQPSLPPPPSLFCSSGPSMWKHSHRGAWSTGLDFISAKVPTTSFRPFNPLESILKLSSSLLHSQEWWKATKGAFVHILRHLLVSALKSFCLFLCHTHLDIHPSSNPVLFYCIHFKEFSVLWPHLSNFRMINSFQWFPNNRIRRLYLLLRTHCFCRNC